MSIKKQYYKNLATTVLKGFDKRFMEGYYCETKEEALIREIKEELDCTIKPTKFALDLEYQYPTFYLKMSCFEAIITEGTPKLLEHNDARWLTKEQLDDVNWIPADLKIIDYLKETMED